MVSDGMSPGVLTMAQNFSRISRQKQTAWWEFYHHGDTARGLMDTASANSMVTDSAAASSAWGGGKRINNGAINIAPDGSRVPPIAALMKGWDPKCMVGLVTTATVTHATPAGFAAQSTDRDLESMIAPQYLDRVDLILGGGAKFFDPALRDDQRDLLGEFRQAGYETVFHRDGLLATRSAKILGLFATKHLPFTVDRDQSEDLRNRVPTLEEMSAVALDRCLASGQRFLLQIEGARIDHGAHVNDAAALLHDQLAFDDALGRVLEITAAHPDILVVATSDHGNANPGLNGMGVNYVDSNTCFERLTRCKASYERLLDLWGNEESKTPQMLQSLLAEHLAIDFTSAEAEAVIASFQPGKVIEWNHQLGNPQGILGQVLGNHTGISWNGLSHTSDPTIVNARGPGAERFEGMVVNTDVFTHIGELLS